MKLNNYRKAVFALAAVLCVAAVAASYAQKPGGKGGADGPGGPRAKACKMWKHCGFRKITDAVCVLHPTEGNSAKGVVRFSRVKGGVKVVAEVQGLTPNAQHAIHIHEFGDCSSADGTSAGGHYNPKGHPHGLPSVEKRHAGDLGNLTADAQGNAHYELTVHNIRIAGPWNPIIGRSVVVHAQVDDGSQPTGNAGARISYGVIGVAKSTSPPPESDDDMDSDNDDEASDE